MPTVALVTEAFATLGGLTAHGLGRPGIRMITFPHPLNPRPAAEVEALGVDLLADVVAGITSAVGEEDA